jgi:hypothetical protein
MVELVLQALLLELLYTGQVEAVAVTLPMALVQEMVASAVEAAVLLIVQIPQELVAALR